MIGFWSLAYTSSALAVDVTTFPDATLDCGHWPGWTNIRNMFTFGDSYTGNDFLPNGTQPSLANPIGNPPWPGNTSSAGLNWVGYLVSKYNSTPIFNYNFGFGGATVSSHLVAPFYFGTQCLEDQVETEFLPYYGYQNSTYRSAWASNDTLFTFWIGINDIINSNDFNNGTNATLMAAIFTEYGNLLDIMYDSGARNFLLIDVPTIQKSPLSQSEPSYIKAQVRVIQSWGVQLQGLAKSFEANHTDATVLLFSSYGIFQQILKSPTSYKQTAGLKELKTYCAAYSNGTIKSSAFVKSCDYPVDEYFWLNTLHPTYTVHDALGFSISTKLTNISASAVMCTS